MLKVIRRVAECKSYAVGIASFRGREGSKNAKTELLGNFSGYQEYTS